MRKLVSLILACFLCLGLATAAQAEPLIGLKPCSEVPAFTARANDRVSALEAKVSAAGSSAQSAVYASLLAKTEKRFDAYSKLLCGEEGLPHLVTDGRLNHANEFILPGLAFLYLAGWLGWAGRSYLITVRSGEDAGMKEIIIDLPLAMQCFAGALAWPALAFKEIASGEIAVADNAVPISPR